MPKFLLVKDHFNFPYPTDEQFKNAIFENNTEFIVGSRLDGEFYVECAHQPRDMLVYGITWHRIDE